MNVEALEAELRSGLEGVTPGPWAAWMDDYTVRVDATFIPDQRKVALCATGDGAGRNAAHIARCSPENIAALLDALESERSARVRLEKALTEIANSNDMDNTLDPERNKRVARAALSGEGGSR